MVAVNRNLQLEGGNWKRWLFIFVVFSHYVGSNSFCDPMDHTRWASTSMGFPRHSGAGSHFLLQGIFPNQGSNPHLLNWQEDSLPLRHQGSLKKVVLYLSLVKARRIYRTGSTSKVDDCKVPTLKARLTMA